MIKLSWRFIFNSDLIFGYTVNSAFGMAEVCGYPYIAWNGRIYNVETGKDLGVLSDLKIND